jgi:hypothetical protein
VKAYYRQRAYAPSGTMQFSTAERQGGQNWFLPWLLAVPLRLKKRSRPAFCKVATMTPADAQVIWTDYLRYRAHTRGFDLALIEQLLRFASERYFDTVTRRWVVIGQHGSRLVMVPYDQEQNSITPVTIHVTTRQQVTFRLRTGRFVS